MKRGALGIFTFWILMALTNEARAFQILSSVSQPCHESMTLGLFGFGPNEFRVSTSSVLFNRFVATVRQIGVPPDRATWAAIKEMDARFNWSGLDDATRFVLASLVAGARMPDTHGFSVIDINHIRDNHLTDSAQATHLLRNRADDGNDGNTAAIQRTRAQVTSFIAMTLNEYQTSQYLTSQDWAFPFYGEVSVQFFAPAFYLGQVAHSIEDSYSHTIRDSSFNILAVANYIEAMSGSVDEERDGPPHSDRLDQCNMADAFDSMRITEAQRQLVLVFNQIDTLMGSGSTNDASVETILDSVFNYRTGCDANAQYCGSEWIAKAREQISQPYKLGYNCGLVRDLSDESPRGPWGGGAGALVLVLLLLPLAFLIGLRRRA